MVSVLGCTLAFALACPAEAEELSSAVHAQIAALQAEKLARTSAQRKLDAQLHYLAREAVGAKAVAGMPDLKSRAEREQDGRVIVDIAAVPGTELNRAISAVGGTILYESPRWHAVRAIVPPRALDVLSARTDVASIRCGEKHQTHTGPITSAGDTAHRAGLFRTNSGANGAGIKLGIISDSVDYLGNSIGNGELPPAFAVVPGRSGFGSGEGTAMAEVIHDLAPGAELWFATGTAGIASFADSILQLRSRGCQIILDDVTYSAESPFQDDVIAQAVNQVVTNGALYLSAAGNGGSLKKGSSSNWEGDFADGGAAGAPLPSGRVHGFGARNYNSIASNSNPGLVSLHWSDEWETSGNDYDLYILNNNGTAIVAASTNPQDGNDRPYEAVFAQIGERVVVWKASSAAPRYLRLSCVGGRFENATAGNIPGHAGTAYCLTVAASDASLAYPNPFTGAASVSERSADGPRKRFYNADSTPISPGNFLASGGTNVPKPDLTAAEGVATSVPGFAPFYGTSAAASHAAAIAALVWSRRTDWTATQVRTMLQGSCIDIEAAGFDINAGHGILMADLALANMPAPNPIATNIGTRVNGPNLELSWPQDRIGWRLLAQTNRLASGISTNLNDWTAIPGASATNTISVLINNDKPVRFYRLIYP